MCVSRRDALHIWPRFISTHAPAWSATITMTPPIFSNAEFQLTHPRGVQQDTWSGPRVGGLFQLPHPMWGATRRAAVLVVLRDTFQLTHPCRVRRRSGWWWRPHKGFQLTHPRGVRRLESSSNYIFRFISTHAPCEGCNVWTEWTVFSTHIPQGRATLEGIIMPRQNAISTRTSHIQNYP